MAPKLFESDSEDSIRTDYTTEPDPDTEYNIEKILYQDVVNDRFLIKWETYPINEATWEPRHNDDGTGLSNVESDDELFVKWRQHLQAVKDGKEKAFDPHEWQKSWEKLREEQNEKRARRNAKRRRKNLPTRPDTIEEEERLAQEFSEEEDESEDEPLAKRVATTRPPPQKPVHRKGVAQKLKKRRHEHSSDSSSSEDSGEVSSDDSGDSLMEEMSSSRRARTRTSPIKRPPRPDVIRKPLQTFSAVSPKKQRLGSTSVAQPARGEPRQEKQTQQRPAAPMRTQSIPSDTLRKVVPSSNATSAVPARAKKSNKNVMANWGADKQKRKRVPPVESLTGETDSRKFQNLAIQNAVNTKRAEAAPDVRALNIIDPKTGKVVVPSKVKGSGRAQEGATAKSAECTTVAPRVTSNTPPATGIHGAYARRSPPPNANTRGAVPTRSVSDSTSVSHIEDMPERRHPSMTDEFASGVRGFPTCSAWLKGTCPVGAQECKFLHSYAAGDPKKLGGEYASKLRLPPEGWAYDASQLLCHFFRTKGSCKAGSKCQFAHHDAEYDAPPPKVSVDDARASQAAFAKSSQPLSPATGSETKMPGPAAAKLRLPPAEWVYNAGHLYCHFFRTTGTCSMGTTCKYAHRDTGYDAPPPRVTIEEARASQAAFANSQQPSSTSAGDAAKISGQAATKLRLPPPEWDYNAGHLYCYFFRTNGTCIKGDGCKYAHHDTGYDAPPPGVTIADAQASQAAYEKRFESLRELAESASTASTSAQHIKAAPTAATRKATSTPTPKYEPMSKDPQKIRQHPENGKQYPGRLTCHFWRTQNGCTKGSSCMYAHFDTGFDALPPGRAQRMLVQPATPNANLEPIGYQRWTPGTDTEMTVQTNHQPAFSEPQYAKVPGPTPLQTSFPPCSDVVMSPGLMTASPMHTSLSDSRVVSATAHSLWDPHDIPTGFVTRNATIKLYHQGSERPHNIRLKLNVLGDRAFTRLIGDEPSMRVEHAILTSDVKALLWDDIQHSSNAAAATAHMEVAPEHEMSGLAELCKLHDFGVLAAVEGYSANVLIYPSNAEQWKFLEAPGLLSKGGASLKLCVFDGCPGLRGRLSSKASPVKYDRRSSATIVGESLAQLERDRLFPKSADAVFLMIPPAHAAELEVLNRVFASESRCKVYHSGTAGAWMYFCRKYTRSGVVLVHPNVPLWQIPKLHELTLQTTTFFTIGMDLTSAILDARESIFECTRILPLGGAALLTDDLITNHPEKATEIIQNFLDATSCKPEGAEMNKIVARPGLKRFLLENFIERGRPDGRWLRLYGAVCDLCPPEDEDLEDYPNPLETSHLVSINPDLLPSFAGLWEANAQAADDLLVEWFAGWTLLNASALRKFAIVTGAGTDDRGWQQKYQHIGVMGPEKAMKYVIKGNTRQKGVRNWTSSKQ